MATLLLTWNPDKWRMDFDGFVARTEAGKPVEVERRQPTPRHRPR